MSNNVKIGDIVTVYGAPCRVVRILPFGTIDVERVDGSRAWRISGLALDVAREREEKGGD